MSGIIASSGQVNIYEKIDGDKWEYIVTIKNGKPVSVQETWFRGSNHEKTRQIEPSDCPQHIIEEVEKHMIPKGAFTRSGEP